MGMWCHAHRSQLAAKVLADVPIVAQLSMAATSISGYFSRSPKRLGELQSVTVPLGLGCIRPLRNVATRWISLMRPLERIFLMYTALTACFDKAADGDKPPPEAAINYNQPGVCTLPSHVARAFPPDIELPGAPYHCARAGCSGVLDPQPHCQDVHCSQHQV